MAFSKCVRDAHQLTVLKPTKVKNDVAAKFSVEKGTLNVTLQRYTTRMRLGERQASIALCSRLLEFMNGSFHSISLSRRLLKDVM